MQFDTSIPIPDGDRFKWPLRDMPVGSSVFIPKSFRSTRQIQTYAHSYGKGACKRFTTRARIENGVYGVRIWRVA